MHSRNDCTYEREIDRILNYAINYNFLCLKNDPDLLIAGLDRMRVSLQGLSTREYEKCSKFKLDFEQFLEELRYFYSSMEKSTESCFVQF